MAPGHRVVAYPNITVSSSSLSNSFKRKAYETDCLLVLHGSYVYVCHARVPQRLNHYVCARLWSAHIKQVNKLSVLLDSHGEFLLAQLAFEALDRV